MGYSDNNQSQGTQTLTSLRLRDTQTLTRLKLKGTQTLIGLRVHDTQTLTSYCALTILRIRVFYSINQFWTNAPVSFSGYVAVLCGLVDVGRMWVCVWAAAER